MSRLVIHSILTYKILTQPQTSSFFLKFTNEIYERLSPTSFDIKNHKALKNFNLLKTQKLMIENYTKLQKNPRLRFFSQ